MLATTMVVMLRSLREVREVETLSSLRAILSTALLFCLMGLLEECELSMLWNAILL
jgi:hypothetical protein